MSFVTGWINLAGLQGYQRAYYFFILANYLSAHKIQTTVAYDFNESPTQSFLIAPNNFTDTYGSDATWGDSGTYGGNATLEQWRCFFATQKCQSFQISMTEVFDPQYGTDPGAGFTLSGLNIVFGTKKGWPRLPAAQQTG